MARVLIVDDVEIVRKALQISVKKMGHVTDGASSPREALELARANPPDLALVDFRMPEMDGVDFFSALQELLGERCPKVLFVSATPAEEVRRRLEPQGLRLAGFVKKPFHLDDLWREVDHALSA